MTTLESGGPDGKPVLVNLDTDAVFSTKQTAAALGVSIATLKRLWAAGQGPTRRRLSPHRVGSKGRDIAQYLEANAG